MRAAPSCAAAGSSPGELSGLPPWAEGRAAVRRQSRSRRGRARGPGWQGERRDLSRHAGAQQGGGLPRQWHGLAPRFSDGADVFGPDPAGRPRARVRGQDFRAGLTPFRCFANNGARWAATGGLHLARSIHKDWLYIAVGGMRIMAANDLHLATEWALTAPPEAIWAVLTHPEDWPSWWRAVEGRADQPGDPEGLNVYRRFTWRTALPYCVRFAMRVTHVEPMSVIEDWADGELSGVGRWTLTPTARGHPCATTGTSRWTVVDARRSRRFCDRCRAEPQQGHGVGPPGACAKIGGGKPRLVSRAGRSATSRTRRGRAKRDRRQSLGNAYSLFVLEVVRAVIDPAQKNPKTIHHRGYGAFTVDRCGAVTSLPVPSCSTWRRSSWSGPCRCGRGTFPYDQEPSA